MPGLFDSVTPFLSGLRGGVLGSIGSGLANAQNAGTIDQGLGQGMGQLMLSNPQAAQLAIGQRNLQATIQALTPQFGPERATFFALHPEELSKLSAPQKVGPAEHLEAPLNLLGPPQQQAPQLPAQAGIQGQPSQMPQPQQSQGQGYQGPQNNAGLFDQPSLQALVERRLKGDTEVNTELSGGMSGLNVLNKANFQKLLAQTMQQQNISPSDLASRDAKFPAYRDATKTNGQVAARMQLAQSEASGMLPLLTQAAASTNPTNYPIFNRAKLEVLAQTGDPRSAQLASYANALINTYARGISARGQGPTDSDKAHLREIVNPYWSKGQWEAGARAIMNELGVAHGAIQKNQNRIDVQYGFGKNADPNDVAAAKAAIAKGADREDVSRRFEEGGFNAPKF